MMSTALTPTAHHCRPRPPPPQVRGAITRLDEEEAAEAEAEEEARFKEREAAALEALVRGGQRKGEGGNRRGWRGGRVFRMSSAEIFSVDVAFQSAEIEQRDIHQG